MKNKIFLCLLMSWFLMALTPAGFAITSEKSSDQTEVSIESDPNLTDVSSEKDKKTDKKKDKDVIDIDAVFFISLAINIITVLLIICLIYYPNYKKMDYIFTYIIFNLVIFVLTFVLNKVKISMGAAFGLFAVFSMLRYRSAGISLKDMSYLFVFIGIGLISAIQLEYYELGILHGVIFIGIYLLDGNLIFKRELSKNVQYEVIEKIKPENQQELIEDLCIRTGLKIHRITINKINFLKDTATIRIYYYE
ncbi:MAG: DUF4956 domain-containing protein [Alphaproteobacteria bacterium]|nr:DUF4956 domain-containing protein [Alphaproteobacteria bacterium]